MKIIYSTIAAVLATVVFLTAAVPASAENAYISAKDARYYARDAVRAVHPDSFHIRASCDRASRSLFICDVSWVRSHVHRHYAKARVRGLENDGQRSVKTSLIETR